MIHHTRHSERGPALILVPGLAATARFFDRAVADLGADHAVVTVDLPGHGLSRDAGPGPRTPATLAGAARGLRAVIEELDLDGVTLVGWSLGATVAYTYLEESGTDRISSLISVEQTPYLLADGAWPHAAFGGLTAEGAAQLQDALESAGDTVVENLVRGSFATGSDPDQRLVAELIAQGRGCDPDAMRGLLADVVQQDWRERVGQIKSPTLLIHGARSAVYPTAVGAWLAEALPESRLSVFEHSGHLPFIEEPERFANEVRAFVAEQEMS
jgi:pimeloyl-ACP methyl ester carboxylesterase